MIENNTILMEARFLAIDPLSEITPDETEKHRVRIDNLMNIITYLLHKRKAMNSVEVSSKRVKNPKIEKES